MKSKNLFIGIIILFVGVVALLTSLDVISFSWDIALRLWPLLLILLGVIVLPINEYLKSALLVLLLGLGCLLYQNEAARCPEIIEESNACDSSTAASDSCVDETVNQDPYVQEFSEPFDTYAHATLNVDFGAGDFEIESPCAELVLVKSDSDIVKYNFLVERNEDEARICITGNNVEGVLGKYHNELNVALNDQPLWAINIETGASDCDFDFSPYKVEKLSIESGACDMDIRLGDNGCDTEMLVESGASDIEIEVPDSMGCRILFDAALTSKDFEGFEKKEEGVWETSNFDSAEHYIVITLDCGVSNIRVERY